MAVHRNRVATGSSLLVEDRFTVSRQRQNLVEAFESEFGIELRDADLGLSEHARCEAAIPAIDARDWLDHSAASIGDVPLLSKPYRKSELAHFIRSALDIDAHGSQLESA